MYKMLKITSNFLILIILFHFFACAPKKPKENLIYKKVNEKQIERLIKSTDITVQGLSSWKELDRPLLDTSRYLYRKGAKDICIQNQCISTPLLKETIDRFVEILPELDRDANIIKDKFEFYKLTPKTFFTGYFEMDVNASLTRDKEYRYPIYGLPSDLKKVNLGRFHPRWRGQTLIYRIEGDEIRPYYSRKEIDGEHKIKGKAPVLAWAKSLVDIYFLQIQGSGRLILPDGSFKYIGYAGKNGRQYVSLGKYLIEKGYITPDQGNLEGIVNYLNSNPDKLPDILFINPSYVFFRFLDCGPVGAIGVKLMPLVSIAVDPEIIPLGSIGIYEVKLPGMDKEMMGFFIAQDVGGAIENNHVDLFCGFGENARHIAGNLSQYGNIYLMLKKEK